MSISDDFKGTLPDETDASPDSDAARPLRSIAENEVPLSRKEAEVAGITPETRGVHGDDSHDPNDESDDDDDQDDDDPEDDQ